MFFLGKPIAAYRIVRPVLRKHIAAQRAESLFLREWSVAYRSAASCIVSESFRGDQSYTIVWKRRLHPDQPASPAQQPSSFCKFLVFISIASIIYKYIYDRCSFQGNRKNRSVSQRVFDCTGLQRIVAQRLLNQPQRNVSQRLLNVENQIASHRSGVFRNQIVSQRSVWNYAM